MFTGPLSFVLPTAEAGTFGYWQTTLPFVIPHRLSG